MKFISKIRQSRRDFTAIYECEACGNRQNINGYDDANYYNNVIPTLACDHCGESTQSLRLPVQHIMPTVPEGVEL